MRLNIRKLVTDSYLVYELISEERKFDKTNFISPKKKPTSKKPMFFGVKRLNRMSQPLNNVKILNLTELIFINNGRLRKKEMSKVQIVLLQSCAKKYRKFGLYVVKWP